MESSDTFNRQIKMEKAKQSATYSTSKPDADTMKVPFASPVSTVELILKNSVKKLRISKNGNKLPIDVVCSVVNRRLSDNKDNLKHGNRNNDFLTSHNWGGFRK